MHRALFRVSTFAIAAVFTAVACGQPAAPGAGGAVQASPARTTTAPSASAAAPASTLTSKAADLRTTLNLQLSEHVYLAGFAVAESLLGNAPGFEGGAAALESNTVELGKTIGAAYGAEAEKRFLELWRAHIGMFVAYAQGAAKNDAAAKQKAVADLDGYRRDFDAFLSGANPNLPKGAVADLLVPHVQQIAAAVDGIAAGDFAKGFDSLKMAADQSQKIADPLAAAVAKQFPDKFPGDPASKAVDLRVSMNNLLGSHVYLAGLPVRMALAGSDPGFKAGAATLDKNTVELGKNIGSVYGAPAESRFLELWRAHIGMFVAYTQGAAKNDAAAKDKAVKDLDGYRRDFDAFLSGANPNLPRGAVEQLLAKHVSGIAKAVDQLAAKDYKSAYASLKTAEDHSQMIADPLTEAIVKQFPDKLGN